MMRLILLSVLFIVCSCSYLNPIELIRNEGEVQLYDYYIDDYGNEGVVVCVTDHEIMVISSDEGLEYWGPSDLSIMSDNIHYSGVCSMQTMQNAIVNGIDRFPAFRWCHDKNPNDLLDITGWMLPCERELMWMFRRTDLSLLNKALVNIGGTPISSGALYWTASEDTDDFDDYDEYGDSYIPEMRAVCITPELDSDYKMIYWIKSQKHKVRAVKYIKYKKNE